MKSLFVVVSLLLPILSTSTMDTSLGLSESEVVELQYLSQLTKEINKVNGTFILPRSILQFNDNDVSFIVYTNTTDVNGTQVNYKDGNVITSVSSFNLSLETVIIIHGWRNTYESTMITLLKEALFEVGNYNVIAVDWDFDAELLYLEAVSAVPNVGRITGHFINNITTTYNYSIDQITIIGHSLGAQAAGFAGQETNGTVGTIIGLDPAGPLFFQGDPSGRLDATDAQFVQAIHTCGALLGVEFSIGDADFWPNGGFLQPGCDLDVFGSCSHGRAYKYMAESIVNDAFYAKSCSDYANYDNGKCNNNPSYLMGGKPKSYNTELSGNYYLNTNSEDPYGLGNVDP